MLGYSGIDEQNKTSYNVHYDAYTTFDSVMLLGDAEKAKKRHLFFTSTRHPFERFVCANYIDIFSHSCDYIRAMFCVYIILKR